ncbi:transposase family protein [Streptomyces sp. A30]|uniref:transposase family protein n=1 Tax=Streptomyces sp. A30 TaxID=2789273 RepID=UPI00398155BE
MVVTGFKATRARRLACAEKEANRVLAAGRVPVERSFAHLKNWRILTKLRTDPARATHLFRALFVLTNIEAATDNGSLPQVAHDQHMPPEQRHRAGIG